MAAVTHAAAIKTSKNVRPIKIKITTNMSETPFVLTYSNIYNPAPGKLPKRANMSSHPFFTADVLYPYKSLANKPYTEILYVFFDKDEFIRSIINDETEHSTTTPLPPPPANKMDYANENIMTMLRLLFPISYPTKGNISNTYDRYLSKQGEKLDIRIDFAGEIKSLMGQKQITPDDIREYSYLKTSDGVCTITQVLWMNDVLNHPEYRKLVDKLIEYTEWVETQEHTITKDITEIEQKLLRGINTAGGHLFISPEDIFNLQKQIRIYREDNIKGDMIKIIKEHVIINPGSESIFEEKIEKMVQDFIDDEINGKTSQTLAIKQLSKFIDKFNFNIKQIHNGTQLDENLFMYHNKYDNDLTKIENDIAMRDANKIPNIDASIQTNPTQSTLTKFTLKIQNDLQNFEPNVNASMPPNMFYLPREQPKIGYYYISSKFRHLFSIKDEDPDIEPNKLNPLKTTLLRTPINDLLKDLFNNVIERYIFYLDIPQNTMVQGNYIRQDELIKAIVRDIDDLKSTASKSQLNYSKILDLTQSIKKTFDQLASKNVSILQSIGSKLEKIIKLSNELKFLKQLKSEFFSTQRKGIFVDYAKNLDRRDPFNNLFLEELSKEKYATFRETIKFIKDEFIKLGASLNSELQLLIDDYFANKNNNFYTDVLKDAEKVINEGMDPKTASKSSWNTSVSSVKNGKEIEYEILVTMELILGELNPKNQSDIECDYLHNKLTDLFEELTGVEKISYGPPKYKAPVFSIAKAKEEKKKHEEEKKKEIEVALMSSAKKTEETPSSKGGQCIRKNHKTAKINKKNKVKKTAKLFI